jgi:hypothetical protein
MDNGEWRVRRKCRDMVNFSVFLAILAAQSEAGFARFLRFFE